MANRPDAVIPILRSGILACEFCERVAIANVEAVFERCVYLRSGDDFVCIGEPDIGNGPIALIGNLGSLPALKCGQVALICSEHITIGNSVRFTLTQSELWRAVGWSMCPTPERLIDICAALVSLIAIGGPEEGLARCVTGGDETSERLSSLARVARPRITIFEHWMSEILNGTPISAIASCEAVQGLIGLGPGLTPSGDDFLVGALALLDALGEGEAHTAMTRALLEALPGLTAPISACLLRAAAAGHVGENLHQVVSLVITGDVDSAIAAAAEIGHSSGWDMIAGIVTTLRAAATQRRVASIADAFAPS
jgi:hypothetical protein